MQITELDMVRDILSNEVYIGNIVSLQHTSKSFKDKRLVERPKDEWIRVENTHEPLVDKDTFYTVQKRISVKRPFPQANPANIFRGLLVCGECGAKLAYKKENCKTGTAKYQCNLYLHRGNQYCTIHSIKADELKEIVLDDINRHIKLSNEDKAAYVEYLIKRTAESQNGDKESAKKELQKINQRLAELDKILQSLYEDKVFKRISDERYTAMSLNLESEEKQLKSRCSELQTKLAHFTEQGQAAKDFADLIEQYSPIAELDTVLLNTLIEKIVIHEHTDEDGNKVMPIEIYYRFIGSIGSN